MLVRARWRIIPGPVTAGLQSLADGSVHCCVTSPPYWGLRDYGVDGQYGLEATIEEYLANQVSVFREVRRVLRNDGTLWLNVGDSYVGGGRGPDVHSGLEGGRSHQAECRKVPRRTRPAGTKPKDLLGLPWLLALALRADGWYLRADIIWSKPNLMPESVNDRPTKSHEYLFLLTKRRRYFYDAAAIYEPVTGTSHARAALKPPSNRGAPRPPGVNPKASQVAEGNHRDRPKQNSHWSAHHASIDTGKRIEGAVARNRRSVWTVPTEPYPGAHFATFPRRLVRPCILAGTSEAGCCSECGAPWRRVLRPTGRLIKQQNGTGATAHVEASGRHGRTSSLTTGYSPERCTAGWQPGCQHDAPQVPCTVLDPYLGSGTTLAVAVGLGRNGIGCELSPSYIDMARARIGAVAPLLAVEATTIAANGSAE